VVERIIGEHIIIRLKLTDEFNLSSIMLKFSPIMLLSMHFILLKEVLNKYTSKVCWADCDNLHLSIQVTDCSIRMYHKVIVLLEWIDHILCKFNWRKLLAFCNSLPNMQAICLMLSSTYYGKNYVDMIGLQLGLELWSINI